MRPHIAAAGVVVIAPLAIGGGTRVKILEAQAMARPVVSTTIGAEGRQGQRDGDSILIGDDAESFAGHVVRVLKPIRKPRHGLPRPAGVMSFSTSTGIA